MSVRAAMSALLVGLALACAGGGGRYAGDASIEVELTSDAGTGMHDADVLVRRLEALGVDATAVDVAPDRIVLQVKHVSLDPHPIRDVLAPRRLRIHLVDERDPACEWDDDACILRQLQQPAALTNADVANARVDYPDDQPPVVVLDFTAAGRQRFSGLTTAGVGRRLAIVIDDELLSAPMIHEPIPGGTAWITMGTGDADPSREAEALVAALRTGSPLDGAWTLAVERPVGTP